MADERYQWLDQEAAERLLRGDPVDPVDPTARAEAVFLARALDTARTPAASAADGELPGEAAALAAFRKVTAERAAQAAAQGQAGRATAADLGAVRIAPDRTGHRWGRSLRYGLAAAFAAVTVGGVAVAAGTGVLPLTSDPGPGSSVVAADPSAPATSGSPSGGIGTDGPDLPKDPDRPTATPGVTDGPGTATAGPGGDPTATPGATTAGPGQETDVQRSKVVQACQEYRAGKLADSGRERLAAALRNGETVKRYCDRILAGGPSGTATLPSTGRTSSGGNGGSGSGSGSNSGSGSGSGNKGSDSGNGDGDGDDKSDRGGHGGGKGRGEDRGADRGDGRGDGRDQGLRGTGDHGRNGSRS
ncbi:hypothetical protein ACIGO8_04010 [Streptomyces sp. NPDC053493]|uniref:hypothetical protein n=1 Tax=Streptomyces sp. NPDC053493 TaxID=3365705 RepID=UPI0037D5EACF